VLQIPYNSHTSHGQEKGSEADRPLSEPANEKNYKTKLSHKKESICPRDTAPDRIRTNVDHGRKTGHPENHCHSTAGHAVDRFDLLPSASQAAYSASLGGGISALVTLYFASKVFSARIGCTRRQNRPGVLWGEVGKLLLTVISAQCALLWLPVSPLPLFCWRIWRR
jgi:hypothetical protein